MNEKVNEAMKSVEEDKKIREKVQMKEGNENVKKTKKMK